MTTDTPISTSVPQQAPNVPVLDPEVRIKLYETMVLSRTYEEALLREYHADKGPGFDIGKGLVPGEMHLSAGQEPVAAGVCAHLTTDDAVTPDPQYAPTATSPDTPSSANRAMVCLKVASCSSPCGSA